MLPKGRMDSRYVKILISLILLGLIYTLYFFLNEYSLNLFLDYILVFRYFMLFAVVYLGGFGVPIPVNLFLMAIGAFIAGGYFNVYATFFVTLVANVLGDSSAYFFFRKVGHVILRDKYAEKYGFFVRLEKFFINHQKVSIFVSRFIGIFCTPVDFLAGYMKIPYKRFLAFDILGNIVFAVLFLGTGYLVGEKWLRASDMISNFMGALSVLIVVYIIKTLFEKGDEVDKTDF